jgi:hypothetical protein
MPDLRSSLLESINRLRSDLSPATQAQMSIPMGTVQHARQIFESRILRQSFPPDSLLVARALDNTDELIRRNQSYAHHLRLVEALTLFHLPADARRFLRDHDSLYRAALRSRDMAALARRIDAVNMDVFMRVAHRLINLKNVYALNIIRESRAAAERARMAKDPMFDMELRECTELLAKEMVRILGRLEEMLVLAVEGRGSDVELENVGPDHIVDDFGCEIVAREVSMLKSFADEALRCCICLDPYSSASHPAFQLTKCGHVVGKPCLAMWLNSTSTNSNLCPCCRTTICRRRSRRPAEHVISQSMEQNNLIVRMNRAVRLLEDTDQLSNEVFANGAAASKNKWFTTAIEAVNSRLFETGVGFAFVHTGVGEQLGLRRVDWMTGNMLA